MSHSIDGAPSPDPVLVTERTVLRAARDPDIPALHRDIFGVPEVMRYVFAGNALSTEEAKKLICQHFNFGKGKIGLSVLTDRASGDVLGFAGLYPCDVLGKDDLEIGFVLARKAWGKGLAREIGEAQLSLGFRELKCSRLLALAYPDNLPSLRTIEALGMSHATDVVIPGRGPRRVYSMSAAEWAGLNAARSA
jgi:RimJ/RimL family protein N-acetyltransferase